MAASEIPSPLQTPTIGRHAARAVRLSSTSRWKTWWALLMGNTLATPETYNRPMFLLARSGGFGYTRRAARVLSHWR